MKEKKTYIVILVSVIGVLLLSWLVVLFVKDAHRPSDKGRHKARSGSKTTREARIPLDLVKEIMSQQRESSYNLRQLAMGGIESISINKVTEEPESADLKITANYTDNSKLDGSATFWKRDGSWYLVEITRDERRPGQPTGTMVADLTKSEIEFGKEIVRQQQTNQQVPADLINGTIKNLTVNKVINEIDDEGRDRSIIDIATTYEDGRNEQIKAQMIHHEGFWYLIRIERS